MIIQSDDSCQLILASVKDWFIRASTQFLRLFVNDVPLNPSTVDPAAFLEASYPGYVQLGAQSPWTDPIRVNAGRWYIQHGPVQFGNNTGGLSQIIRGWVLVRDFRVIFAEKFPAPLTVAPMQPGPSVLIRVSQESKSVILPGAP